MGVSALASWPEVRLAPDPLSRYHLENDFHFRVARHALTLPGSAVTLDTLVPGETGIVEGLEGDGPVDQRLRDLGLVPGTTVRTLRRAPLGDPTEYELRGYRLCSATHGGGAGTSPRELAVRAPDSESAA